MEEVRNHKLKMVLIATVIIAFLPLGLIASSDNHKDENSNDNQRIDKPYVLVDTLLGKVQCNTSNNNYNTNAFNVNTSLNFERIHETGQQMITEDITVNGVSFKMIHVEGGTFTMGATVEQGEETYGSETPAHEVQLSTFSIGETEVTQELWEVVMGYNPSRYTGSQRPVENVSWDDCQAFIFRLNELTGRRFRLPTEAEWEYAARGGNNSNGYKYAGGNDVNSVAWYSENSNGTTHNVGLKLSNELGLYDMSGNVEEWCQDGYSYYGNLGTETVINPWGNSYLEFGRMYRGGSFESINRLCRVSYRSSKYTDVHSYSHGFRLAISELSGQNISFMNEFQQVLATQSNCTVPVAISRGSSQGNYTARVTFGTPRIENVALQNQWVTFANGEYITYALLLFSDMEVGKTYSCTLNLSENDAATNNPEYGQQILTTSIELICDYNWLSMGNGFYSSPEWWEEEFEVPVQHAEGTNIYRLMGLFQNGYDVQFTINADNTVTVPAQASWVHSSYGKIWLVGDANDTADGYAGTYDPATKKVTFSLYHYVPGVGGFGTFVDTLTMP